MDPERFGRVRRAFEAALDVPPEQREAWLASAAAGDAELRDEVARLLAADAAQEHHPLLQTRAGVLRRVPDLTGRRLGAYTLVRWIGAGGMGAVYEAVEEHPHRRVAVKTLGFGVHDERARRRFEDEVEILARLRHPGIAQVLGAGTWREDGLEVPWFAMELVEEPRPLDRHVRESGLPLAATVTLVQQVCEAVHFAHQRGVIHRDLKPANVLVGPDGTPKIIDFGIARVLGDELTSQLTATGELLGTLAYMSPERLTGGAACADASSDVYALGVILYELIAGRPPYALAQLPPGKALDLVREQDPPPPSAVSARRLPPELDWIAQKAMAREPAQRYASAAELGAELQRFRHGDQIAAGPPSTVYRLKKLVRRHRLMLTAAALVAVALVTGTAVAIAGWIDAARAGQVAETRRAQAQRQATTLAEVNRLQREILGGAYVDAGGRDARVADVLDKATAGIDAGRIGDPTVEIGLRSAIGVSYLGLGLLAEADRQFQRGLDLVERHALDPVEATIASLHNNVGVLRSDQGRLEPAERFLRTALASKLQLWGEQHDETATTQVNLALVLAKANRNEEVLALAERAAATFARRSATSAATIAARTMVATAAAALGRVAEADALFPELLELARRELGPDHAATNGVRSGYGAHLQRQGRREQFAALARESFESLVRTAGEAHPSTLAAMNNLANALREHGDFAGAEACLRRVIAAEQTIGRTSGYASILSRHNLAFVLRRQQKLDEAETLVAALQAEAERDLPAGHWLGAMLQKERGALWRDRGRFAEGETALKDAIGALERLVGAQDFRTVRAMQELVALYEASGRPEAAAPWAARIAAAKK